VLRRITFPGAFFLGTIAVLPFVIGAALTATGLSTFGASGSGTMLITSSGLLIVVGVVRDTFQNIDAELKLHGYDEKLLVR
jgi:preprotein translocase subunit SecY